LKGSGFPVVAGNDAYNFENLNNKFIVLLKLVVYEVAKLNENL